LACGACGGGTLRPKANGLRPCTPGLPCVLGSAQSHSHSIHSSRPLLEARVQRSFSAPVALFLEQQERGDPASVWLAYPPPQGMSRDGADPPAPRPVQLDAE